MTCWEKCHLLSWWRSLSQCTAGRWSLSVSASFNDTYIKLLTLSEGLLLAGSLEWVQSGEPRPVVIGPHSVRAIHALHDGELPGLFGLTNAGLSGHWLPVNFLCQEEQWVIGWCVDALCAGEKASAQHQQLRAVSLCVMTVRVFLSSGCAGFSSISFSKPTSYCSVMPPADMKVFSSLSHYSG